MRILHVISGLDPQLGGPTMALVGMAKSQAALGLDVGVLATWKQTEGLAVADDLRACGVSVRHVGKARGKLSRHPDLARAADESVAASDVVHVHAMWEEVQHQAARAAQRRGVPYVIAPHGMLAPWSLSQSRWGKRLYMLWRARRNLDRAAAIHFTTDAERDGAAAPRLAPPPIVEGLGLDLGEFQTLPPRGFLRRRWPQLAGRRILLFLSRIHYKKGLDQLIGALAQADLPQTTLVIAGPDDGYKATLDKLIAERGLGDRVLFTGMLHGAERIAALVDADLFVLTSYVENFGIAVIEALAAGVPVLISDQVNIHAQVAAAKVGVVVPPKAEVIAAELSRWMADAALRDAAAARARPFAMEHFDWRRIAGRWRDHYERICGGVRKAPA